MKTYYTYTVSSLSGTTTLWLDVRRSSGTRVMQDYFTIAQALQLANELLAAASAVYALREKGATVAVSVAPPADER